MVIDHSDQRRMLILFNACKQQEVVNGSFLTLFQIFRQFKLKLESNLAYIAGGIHHSTATPGVIGVSLAPAGVGNIAVLPLSFPVLKQADTGNITQVGTHLCVAQIHIVGLQVLKGHLAGNGIFGFTHGVNEEVLAALGGNIQGIPLAYFGRFHRLAGFGIHQGVVCTIGNVLLGIIQIVDKHSGLQHLAPGILGIFHKLKVNGDHFLGLGSVYLQGALQRSAGHMLFGNRVHPNSFVIQGCGYEVGLTGVTLNGSGLGIIAEDILRAAAFISPEVHLGDVHTYLTHIVHTGYHEDVRLITAEFRHIQFHSVPGVHLQLILRNYLAVAIIEHKGQAFAAHGQSIEENVRLAVLAHILHRAIFLFGNTQRIDIEVKGNGLEGLGLCLQPLHAAVPRSSALGIILPGSTEIAHIRQIHIGHRSSLRCIPEFPTVNFCLVGVNTEITLNGGLLAGISLIGSRYGHFIDARRQILTGRSCEQNTFSQLLCLVGHAILGDLEAIAILMAGNQALRHFINRSITIDDIGLVKAVKGKQRLTGIHNGKGKLRRAVYTTDLQGVFARSQSAVIGSLQLQALFGDGIVSNADQTTIGHQPYILFTVQIYLEGHRFLLILHGNTGLYSHLNCGGNCKGNGLLCSLTGLVGGSILGSICTYRIVKLVAFHQLGSNGIAKAVRSRKDLCKVQRGNGGGKVDLYRITFQILAIDLERDIAIQINQFFQYGIAGFIFDHITTGFTKIGITQIYSNLLVLAIGINSCDAGQQGLFRHRSNGSMDLLHTLEGDRASGVLFGAGCHTHSTYYQQNHQAKNKTEFFLVLHVFSSVFQIILQPCKMHCILDKFGELSRWRGR